MDGFLELLVDYEDLVLDDWKGNDRNSFASIGEDSSCALFSVSPLENVQTQLTIGVNDPMGGFRMAESGEIAVDNYDSHTIHSTNSLRTCAMDNPVAFIHTSMDASSSNTENPLSNQTTTTKPNMTLSLQRSLNREVMRRVRRRKREEIQQMREGLQRLIVHYHKLQNEFQQTMNTFAWNRKETEFRRKMEAQYVTLSHVLNQLREENYQLKNILSQKQIFNLSVRQNLEDFGVQCRSYQHSSPTATISNCFDFGFTRVTEDIACTLIHRSYQSIHELDKTAKPLPPFIVGDAGSSGEMPLGTTFGWEISHQITDGKEFYVSFSKFLPDITARSAMQTTWESCLNPENTFIWRPVIRNEILHVLNANTFVVRRELRDSAKSEKVIRSIKLASSIEIENGFALGLISLSPTLWSVRACAQERSSFDYVESTGWIDFCTQVDETTGNEGCLVRFFLCIPYDTQKNSYLRLVNILKGLTAWEAGILSSYVKVLM